MKRKLQQMLCLGILTQILLGRIVSFKDAQKYPSSRILVSGDGSKDQRNTNRASLVQRDAPADQTIVIQKKLSKLEKRVRFMKMIRGILWQSRMRGLTIESIKLGAHIKNIFGIKNVKYYLTKLLSNVNIDQKIKILNTKIKRLQQHKSLGQPNLKILKSITTSSDSSGRILINKKFEPGFAGMPFPPFIMNGPHFHPPMNITINSIPNPVAKGQLNPFELEQLNLSNQLQQMARLKEGLDDLDSTLSVVSAKVKLNMNDKYNRLQQINQ